MVEHYGCCGLACHTCPVYWATRVEDQAERARLRAGIAISCNQQYGTSYTAGDIGECDGCNAGGGRLFRACGECRIRACVKDRNLANCGQCPEYPCEEMSVFISSNSGARLYLEQVHADLLA
jgi:hypothetical protein